jgi:hypothetical protein
MVRPQQPASPRSPSRLRCPRAGTGAIARGVRRDCYQLCFIHPRTTVPGRPTGHHLPSGFSEGLEEGSVVRTRSRAWQPETRRDLITPTWASFSLWPPLRPLPSGTHFLLGSRTSVRPSAGLPGSFRDCRQPTNTRARSPFAPTPQEPLRVSSDSSATLLPVEKTLQEQGKTTKEYSVSSLPLKAGSVRLEAAWLTKSQVADSPRYSRREPLIPTGQKPGAPTTPKTRTQNATRLDD